MTARPSPCPTCGNRHPSVVVRHEKAYIHCGKCADSGPKQGTPQAAVAAWNALAKAKR